jgi:hypothetical protein
MEVRMSRIALSTIALLAASIATLGCVGFGHVQQGRVVIYDKAEGWITLIADSNPLQPDHPRYNVLPPVTIRVPEDPKEMGPTPEAGLLLRLDWAHQEAVIFDPATQKFRHVPYRVVEQHDNVRRGDPRVARKPFPVVDRAGRTITVYDARDRKLIVFSVAEELLQLPDETWKFGDEVRYYYKDPGRALRLMNVSKTELGNAGS